MSAWADFWSYTQGPMRKEYQEYETWTFEQWESLPLIHDDLMYQVVDSVTSALASSSLQDMEEDDGGVSSIHTEGRVTACMN
jgi:hypothetical protein